MVNELEERRKAAKAGDPWYRGLSRMVETTGTLTSEGEYIPHPDPDKEPTGPWTALYIIISKLHSKLRPSHGLRTTWYWNKEKFAKILEEIEGNCAAVARILELDHFEASKAAAISSKAAEISSRDIGLRMKTLEEYNLKQQQKQEEEEDESGKETISKWLSPTLDFLARQKDLYENCFKSAGQWLLDDDVFRRWTLGQFWHLRCYGEPGSGKTLLSSILVNHLQERFEQSPNTRVICLYLNEKESKIQTLEALFGSLLKQLIQLDCSTATYSGLRVEHEKVRKRGAGLARPGKCTIEKFLKMELAIYERVYLVVDAFDECEFREELLHEITKFGLRNLSLLITSRQIDGEKTKKVDCDACSAKELQLYYSCKSCKEKEFDLCQLCRDKNITCGDASHKLSELDRVEIDIFTPTDVLKRYVEEELEKEIGYGSEQWDTRRHAGRPDSTTFGRKASKDPKLRERIPEVIAEKAAGRFLLAKLYLDSVKTKETLRAIQDTLDNFPEDVKDMYEESMQRVQNGKHHALGLKVLSRVLCAYRPLSLFELQHLVAITPGETDFDEYEDYDQEDILNSTQGLITIDGDVKTVRLVHLTLEEYFGDEHVRNKWFPNANKDFAEACLTYLNYDTFSKPVSEGDSYDAKVEKYPFVAYASQYWGDHVRLVGSDSHFYNATVRLINDSHRIEACIQAAWATGRPSPGWDFRGGVRGLHLCAWYGLSWIIGELKHEYINIDVRELCYGQTPLMYACRAGQVEVARELLSRGADVNLISGRGRTALFEAVEWDNAETVALLLLQDNLDVNAVNAKQSNRTALMLAADLGHFNTLDLLLGHANIDANRQDIDGYTALLLATTKGHEHIVRALLEQAEVDMDLVEYIGASSCLIRAAGRNHCGILELLLNKGANPMLKDHHGGGTAMLRAADKDCVSALEILLGNQENLRCLDDDDRTLLHGASAHGCLDVVLFLQQKGLNLDARDRNGLTPLHEASRQGHVAVVDVLLVLGADSTAVDDFERTPRLVAWQHGNADIMKSLECHDAANNSNPTPTLNEAKRPVWSMAKLGLLAPLEEVITTRKSELLETEPGSKYTALHWATLTNQINILKILLEKANVSPGKANRYGRTPLHFAAIRGNLPAISELLTHGANVDAEDQWGISPLFIAQAYKCFSAGVALIEGGAAVDENKINVEKMFFEAVRLGNVKVVEILLKKGADKLSRDVEGMTAMQLAKEADNPEMIRALTLGKTFRFQVDDKELENICASGRLIDSEVPAEHNSSAPFRSRSIGEGLSQESHQKLTMKVEI